MTWADAIDHFVKPLLSDGYWPTTSNGSSIAYWPGVADDPSINLLSDYSARVAFENVLDINTRLSAMRQGISPKVFCGNISTNDGQKIDATEFSDRTTGLTCNSSQTNALDSSCCLTDAHMLSMSYLVEGGYYPSPSDSKWGIFDGSVYFAPPEVLCEAGTAFNSSSQSCTFCLPGTAASGTASRFECTACVAGKYAHETGMVKCSSCKDGFFTDEPGSINCEKCPAGAQCAAGTQLVVLTGFWRTSKVSRTVLPCPYGTCAGGNGTSRCLFGSTGPLCGVCVGGYFNDGATCVSCRVHASTTAYGIGILTCVTITGVLSVCMWLYKVPLRIVCLRGLVMLKRRFDTQRVKICWVGTLSVPFPFSLLGLLTIGVSNLMAHAVHR